MSMLLLFAVGAPALLSNPIAWLTILAGMVGCLLVFGVHRLVSRQRATVAAEPPPIPPGFERYLQPPAEEQRKAPRRRGNPTEVSIVRASARLPEMRGYVLDRSLGGLCLEAAAPLLEGETLSLLPVNAPTMTPPVEVTVKSCRECEDGSWQAGCQFVKVPPWSVPLMFG
jgi:hypothetical protein